MTEAPRTVGPPPATGTLGVGWAEGEASTMGFGVGVGVAVGLAVGVGVGVFVGVGVAVGPGVAVILGVPAGGGPPTAGLLMVMVFLQLSGTEEKTLLLSRTRQKAVNSPKEL